MRRLGRTLLADPERIALQSSLQVSVQEVIKLLPAATQDDLAEALREHEPCNLDQVPGYEPSQILYNFISAWLEPLAEPGQTLYNHAIDPVKLRDALVKALLNAIRRSAFAGGQLSDMALLLGDEEIRRSQARTERLIRQATSGSQQTQQSPSQAPHGMLGGYRPPRTPLAPLERAHLLKELDSAMSHHLGSTISAVTGQRGTGKTQLAAEYSRRKAAMGWPVIWLPAASATSIAVGMAQVADELNLSEPDDQPHQAARRVLRWMEQLTGPCLLVLDDVADPDTIDPWLPRTGNVKVVITTARQSVANLANPLVVHSFTSPESLRYLAERTDLNADSAAEELASELGYLPLALAHAAATIKLRKFTFAQYLVQLKSIPISEYLIRPDGEPYPHAVAQAIQMSLETVASLDVSGLAERVITLCSVLDPAGVPRTLLHPLTILENQISPNVNIAVRVPTSSEQAAVEAAVGLVADCSLITYGEDHRTIIAHRLVQRVVREFAAVDGTLAGAIAMASDLLDFATFAETEAWKRRHEGRVLVSQISALYEHAASLPVWTAVRASENPRRQRRRLNSLAPAIGLLALGRWATVHLCATVNYAEAIEIGYPVLKDHERLLGDSYPTLSQCSHLAEAYRLADQPDLAIAILQRSVDTSDRLLGPAAQETLALRHDLALALQTAGRYDESISVHRQNYRAYKRTVGTTDLSCLRSQTTLAAAYQQAGRTDDAIQLYQGLIDTYQRVAGGEVRDILLIRHRIGQAYVDKNEVDIAMRILEQCHSDYVRIMGQEDLGTLSARDSLAHVYERLNRRDVAVDLLQFNFDAYVRAVGREHSLTLAAADCLAESCVSAGRMSRAIDLFRDTLAIRESTIGPSHRDTMVSRGRLGEVYIAVGEPSLAVGLLQYNVTESEWLLGASHPLVTRFGSLLAFALSQCGEC
jgi:tetratricopeptide (TPR) repeat protein